MLGHIVNDMFSNMLAGLLPVLTVAFGLSYMLAGLVAMVFNVTSSLLQPFLGRWFDHTQTAWLLEAGLALNGVCMSLVGISPTYVILLFLVGTAGVGTASFHPPAFSTVVKSGSSSRGRSMGVFLAGGSTGFFLGPLVAGAVLTAYGLHGTLILLPIGLIGALILLRARVSVQNISATENLTQPPANKLVVGLLASVTACRSTMITAAETFLPLYFVARGEPLFIATALASLWLGIGVLGQLGGGVISDRVGRRPVIVISLLVGASLFLGFLMTKGLVSLILLAFSGMVLYGSWSVIVVMSSEAAPRNVGAVSGLMLGFAVGIGGFAALGFGAVADHIGLQSGLAIFTLFAFAGGLLALVLPKPTTVSSQLPQ